MNAFGKSVFTVVLCTAALHAGAETLRTAAELAAVNRGERTAATNFELTATLVRLGRPENTDSVYVADASGATSLRFPFAARKAPLNPGDRLRLAGTVGGDGNGCALILAETCAVVGTDAPPAAIPAHVGDVHSGRVDFRLIRLTGVVHDVYVDEIDRQYAFLVLVEGGETVYAAIPSALRSADDLQALVGATVTITGICDAYRVSNRRHLGRTVNPIAGEDLVVVRPADSDRFSAPDVSTLIGVSPHRMHLSGRRTVRGRVLAAWDAASALITTRGGECVGIEIAEGPLPEVGREIVACGLPETDLYNVTLTRAVWKRTDAPPAAAEPPVSVLARDLVERKFGREIMRPSYHGRAIRLEGLVRTLPAFGNENRIYLDSDGTVFPVDLSARPAAAEGLDIGCRAAFTGVCVTDVERLRPNTVFPRIRGFTLVMRPTDSVTVLARPSWWTPARVWSVFGLLLAVLAGILVWNRSLRRFAEHRGRQLLRGEIETVKSKLQVEERTRLAVELHDSLSQILTGVAMEIAAADDLRDGTAPELATHLSRAGRILKSCRDELRNCLWDLRSDALDERDLSEAVRRTLQPHVDGPQLSVRFNVPRSRVSDNTAHAILRMIRELTVNAVKHGHASSVKIAGSLDAGALNFSVRDNGCGFDPDDCPGVVQGHFGLQGIRERLGKLDGTMKIESSPGRGTRIAIRIPAKITNNEQ